MTDSEKLKAIVAKIESTLMNMEIAALSDFGKTGEEYFLGKFDGEEDAYKDMLQFINSL